MVCFWVCVVVCLNVCMVVRLFCCLCGFGGFGCVVVVWLDECVCSFARLVGYLFGCVLSLLLGVFACVVVRVFACV